MMIEYFSKSKHFFGPVFRDFVDHFEEFLDGVLRVQTLGTGNRAHSDVLAFFQLDVFGKLFQPFPAELIS